MQPERVRKKKVAKANIFIPLRLFNELKLFALIEWTSLFNEDTIFKRFLSAKTGMAEGSVSTDPLQAHCILI